MDQKPLRRRILEKASSLLLGRDHLLRCAALDGDSERIRDLVAQGADPNRIIISKMPTASEGSPLHGAVIGGHAGAVETLIALGANPNRRNVLGYTPLASWYSLHTRHMRRHGGKPCDLDETAIEAVVALVMNGGGWDGNRSLRGDIATDSPSLMSDLERYVQSRVQALQMQMDTPLAPQAPARRPRRF